MNVGKLKPNWSFLPSAGKHWPMFGETWMCLRENDLTHKLITSRAKIIISFHWFSLFSQYPWEFCQFFLECFKLIYNQLRWSTLWIYAGDSVLCKLNGGITCIRCVCSKYLVILKDGPLRAQLTTLQELKCTSHFPNFLCWLQSMQDVERSRNS